MYGNFWVNFVVLLAVLIIGYELGRMATIMQVRSMFSDMANKLGQAAEKMKKEGSSIENSQSGENR